MKGKSGFTLLEVIVALTILLVGILGAMQLIPASLRNARRANERIAASELVSSRLSILNSQGAEKVFRDTEWEQPPDVLERLRAADLAYSSESEKLLFRNYESTLDRMRGASQVYLQKVVFRIEMEDGRSEKFMTYIAKQ